MAKIREIYVEDLGVHEEPPTLWWHVASYSHSMTGVGYCAAEALMDAQQALEHIGFDMTCPSICWDPVELDLGDDVVSPDDPKGSRYYVRVYVR